MKLEALPQVVRIGFGQLAAFATGFRRNNGQFFFAACQDGPVTLLQIGSLRFSQFLVGAFRDGDAGLLQQAFHLFGPTIVMGIHDKSQFAQQV